MSSACSSVDDDFENRSISELVSFLRTAFRTADFDKVEEILVAREVNMKREIENKNKEVELLQKKKLILEDTLQIDPKELEKRETSEKLKEKEAEVQILKQLIFNVNEDRKAAYEKQKIASAQYEKLLEDGKKIIEELSIKNSELECAKREVELDVELWKNKNEELVNHLSRKGGGKLASRSIFEVGDSDDDHASVKNLSAPGVHGMAKRKRYVYTEGDGEEVIILPDESKAKDSLEKAVGAMMETIQNGSPKSRFSSGICDSKKVDHASVKNLSAPGVHGMAKRKRYVYTESEEVTILPDESKTKDSLKKVVGAMMETIESGSPKSRISSGTYDSKKVMAPSKSSSVTLKQCGKKVGAESKLHSSKFKSTIRGMEDSSKTRSISLESEESSHVQCDLIHFKPKCQGNRDNKKWESEAEMLAAFEENDEICMEAVCVLYRQSKLMEKSFSSSRHRGFQSDVLRGKTLALFLLDRDSDGTMKKSAMELTKFDIRGVSDCRRIAIEHSNQLFEIYQKKEDQTFFC